MEGRPSLSSLISNEVRGCEGVAFVHEEPYCLGWQQQGRRTRLLEATIIVSSDPPIPVWDTISQGRFLRRVRDNLELDPVSTTKDPSITESTGGFGKDVRFGSLNFSRIAGEDSRQKDVVLDVDFQDERILYRLGLKKGTLETHRHNTIPIIESLRLIYIPSRLLADIIRANWEDVAHRLYTYSPSHDSLRIYDTLRERVTARQIEALERGQFVLDSVESPPYKRNFRFNGRTYEDLPAGCRPQEDVDVQYKRRVILEDGTKLFIYNETGLKVLVRLPFGSKQQAVSVHELARSIFGKDDPLTVKRIHKGLFTVRAAAAKVNLAVNTVLTSHSKLYYLHTEALEEEDLREKFTLPDGTVITNDPAILLNRLIGLSRDQAIPTDQLVKMIYGKFNRRNLIRFYFLLGRTRDIKELKKFTSIGTIDPSPTERSHGVKARYFMDDLPQSA